MYFTLSHIGGTCLTVLLNKAKFTKLKWCLQDFTIVVFPFLIRGDPLTPCEPINSSPNYVSIHWGPLIILLGVSNGDFLTLSIVH